MEGRSKGGSGCEHHVGVVRSRVEIRVSVVKTGIIGIVGIKTGVLVTVRIIWM